MHRYTEIDTQINDEIVWHPCPFGAIPKGRVHFSNLVASHCHSNYIGRRKDGLWHLFPLGIVGEDGFNSGYLLVCGLCGFGNVLPRHANPNGKDPKVMIWCICLDNQANWSLFRCPFICLHALFHIIGSPNRCSLCPHHNADQGEQREHGKKIFGGQYYIYSEGEDMW